MFKHLGVVLFRGFMNVNAYQIEYHISQKELKEYAAFCYFKYLFRNGCIYNYNSNKLATKCKYSPAFIRKNVKKFLDKGWCRMHSGNLIFNKSSHFNGTESQIKLYDEANIKKCSIKEILEYFYLQIIKLHDSKLSRLKKLKSDLKSKKAKVRSRAENYADSINKRTEAERAKLPNETTRLILTNSKLARIFKCSTGKASGIIKSLELDEFIKVHRETKKGWTPEKVTGEHMKHLKEMGVSFGMSNWIFRVLPLEFTIC